MIFILFASLSSCIADLLDITPNPTSKPGLDLGVTGTIILLVVIILVGGAIIVFLFYYFCCKRRQSVDEVVTDPIYAPEPYNPGRQTY